MAYCLWPMACEQSEPMTDWEFHTDSLDEHQLHLVRQLAKMRELRRSMVSNGHLGQFHYLGREDFFLRHGEWFPAQAWDDTGIHSSKAGKPHTCYAHSLALCLVHAGLRYVEGCALPAHVPLAVDHAWTIDASGHLIDGVWRNEGLAYLGVRFPLRSALAANHRGDTVLDCPGSRFALYRKPWTARRAPRAR